MDRRDGKLVRLDGLNFSRGRCLYGLVKVADERIFASMDQVIGSGYMGRHWLVTFLVYALEARESMFQD